MRDTAEQRAKEFYPDTVSRPRRGGAFYGDSGAMFNENTRDEIEKNAGAGHPGNNGDISQRYAQSEADEHMEQAERTTRHMEQMGIRLGPARDKFVADMAEHLLVAPPPPTHPPRGADCSMS